MPECPPDNWDSQDTPGAGRPAARLVVRVIGIGGAGCSSLARLSEFLPGGTRFLAIDTGSGANGLPGTLHEIADVIPVGDGFGSGGDPEVAAGLFGGSAESSGRVSRFVSGADVVIIVAGLGRGTGSGISPLVARVSKESGALTLAAVNMPFEFEGRFRSRSAAQALNRLQDSSDSVFVISNDDLRKSATDNGSMSLSDAFKEADRTVSDSVRAVVAALEASEGRFDEVQRSLRQRGSGKSVVLSGLSHGLHAGKAAAERAFASMVPGVFGVSGLSGVKSVVIHVEGGIGLSPGQVAEAVTEVRARTGSSLAEVHVSSARGVALGQRIRVTLVLAGSDSMPGPGPGREPRKLDQNMDQFTSESSSIWPNRQRRTAAVAVFDTLRPVRRRGPMLLPAG